MEKDALDPFVSGLKVAMEKLDLKASPLSLASGLSVSAIRDLFRYRSSPKVSTAMAIASAIGLTVDEIIALGGGAALEDGVAVVGKVGAGAKIPLVDAYAHGDGLYHVKRPAMLPRRGVAAVEVSGDSMSPMYQEGHVLFYKRHSEASVIEDDVGFPCVIEDESGMAWVKLLKRGSSEGLWNLVSLNPSAESAWDVKLRWAARVMLAVPADLVEVI